MIILKLLGACWGLAQIYHFPPMALISWMVAW